MSKKREKKHHEEEEAGEGWLLPYSDLMTLLLAVFIVLFAVSNIDAEKANQMAASFSVVLGSGAGTGGDGVLPGYSNPSPVEPVGPADDAAGTEQSIVAGTDRLNMEHIKETVDAYISKEGLSGSVVTYIDDRGLVISLSNAIFFDSGSAEIKPDNVAILSEIGNAANTVDNDVYIEGHTDNVPMNSKLYPSNWELSCARAARVLRFFAENCGMNQEKMSASGYAEFKPVATNDTPEGRAKNRRINVIVLNRNTSTSTNNNNLNMDNPMELETP